jgi:serine/threonine protein kinase
MGTTSPFTTAVVQASFPRFYVGGEIRAGGQGAVFSATRRLDVNATTTNDRVALKLYFDPSQKERVIREIKALQGYDHPNLSRLIEHGDVVLNGRRVDYVAWEFIDGTPLDLRIAKGVLSSKAVAIVGRDVTRDLTHIWQKRIVHRDVKPNNVILRIGEAEAVLIDLGVARHLNELTLTAPGLIWGTLGYFSPEQSRAEKNLTCNSDVFALGVVLQECLVAHHPTNRNQHTLITATPKTANVCPTCPAALADTIDEMLHSRAAFRPAPSALSQRFADLAQML